MPEVPPVDLSQISTHWLLVHQAHANGEHARAARVALLERYAGAVRRYLRGALRDEHAADDLFQEFAMRLLRGDLCGARSERGRFRDLVKTTLFHLVVDHQRQQRPLPLLSEVPEPLCSADLTQAERQVNETLREALVGWAWNALREWEERTGQPCYTVLRYRLDHPLLSSSELAERVGSLLGRAYSVNGVRQALHRARDRFADLLLAEVVRSLNNPTLHDLEGELADLGLSRYCLAALARFERRAA